MSGSISLKDYPRIFLYFAQEKGKELSRFLNSHPKITLIKNIIFAYVVLKCAKKLFLLWWQRGFRGLVIYLKNVVMNTLFKYMKKIPGVEGKVDSEVAKVLKKLESELYEKSDFVASELPRFGLSESEVLARVKQHAAMGKVKWQDGKVSGTVYDGNDDLTRLNIETITAFAWSNPLHPDVFPGLRKMDAEIVSMVVKMYNGGPDACGTTSSGGTESILLACKAYRDWAREVKGITEPEMVVANSAHAAFDKAAQYFNINIIHVPVDKNSALDVQATKRAINRNTILIVGSCPSYPHGALDDIQALSDIAQKAKIGLHVDCCLGGFLVPFMEKAGYPIPPFDFRLPGVTSISCDTHKYGFAPKGSSVILYSNHKLRQYQYFIQPNWPGGIYASPTLSGSRPGALLAGCWATMLKIGENGYVESTRNIIATARKIAEGISTIPGLYVMGKPQVSVVGFSSDQFDIFRVSTELGHRGWNLNSLQFPPSIHICVTNLTHKVADSLLRDLRDISVELLKNPSAKTEGVGALYGMAQALPDRGIVEKMAKGFVDTLYKNLN